MTENLYYDPQTFGLETIDEIDWIDDYGFDLTVVWRRVSDGAFVYAEDSGCSCPSPFESTGVDELTVIPSRGLEAFKAHLLGRNANQGDSWRPDRSVAIAELLERMHAAGAR